MLWGGVFYHLANPDSKVYFERGIWIISGIAVVDYMFFGTDLGLLTSHLQFEKELSFSIKDISPTAFCLFLLK